MPQGHFEKVISKIDSLNKEDPHQKEFPYSLKLTNWILKLDPQASAHLKIAARGQHICRWTVPRGNYEEGRGGYLRWREDLKKYHAKRVSEIMQEFEFGHDDVNKVSDIILKKNLKTNPDSQTMEDALCLVFLEDQFSDLKGKTPDEKMIDIVKKNLAKNVAPSP